MNNSSLLANVITDNDDKWSTSKNKCYEEFYNAGLYNHVV